MKFHNITKHDMLNGPGLRVVLWLAGCNFHCKGCQNPITWDPTDGLEFTTEHIEEIYRELEKDYCSGLTVSGGDGLYPKWRSQLQLLLKFYKYHFPDKNIWVYTGAKWEDVSYLPIMDYIDVLVDGPFIQDLADITYHYAGSTNQRVIDVRESLKKGEVVLWEREIL